jgi:hypothetical protein
LLLQLLIRRLLLPVPLAKDGRLPGGLLRSVVRPGVALLPQQLGVAGPAVLGRTVVIVLPVGGRGRRPLLDHDLLVGVRRPLLQGDGVVLADDQDLGTATAPLACKKEASINLRKSRDQCYEFGKNFAKKWKQMLAILTKMLQFSRTKIIMRLVSIVTLEKVSIISEATSIPFSKTINLHIPWKDSIS